MALLSVGVRGSDRQFVSNFERHSDRVQTSIERLSTGKRINHASDDPAGLVAAEQLRTELTDLKSKLRVVATDTQATRSRQTGLADIQQALWNLRDKVASATDPSITAAERDAIVTEIGEASAGIDRVAEITGLKGIPELPSSNSLDNGVQNVSDPSAIEELDAQVDAVMEQRVVEGTRERIDQVFEDLYRDQVGITTETLSMIEDTNFAAETSALAQSQVLTQGAIAALGYSNHQRIGQIELLLDALA